MGVVPEADDCSSDIHMSLQSSLRHTWCDGRIAVASAIIANSSDRIFVQRRRTDATVFPGCWAFVGGRVEFGETVRSALAREILEETGWVLQEISAIVSEHRWLYHQLPVEEVTVAATVSGDLARPKLEESSHDDFRWIDSNSLPLLLQNREVSDRAHYEAALTWFRSRSHLTQGR